MKVQSGCLCILALAASVHAIQSDADVTPVTKVISLLQGMLEKSKKAKHEEEVMFAASRTFCAEKKQVKKQAIVEEQRTIEGLSALIAKDTADASHLLKLVSYLNEDQDTWSGNIKAATKVRNIEKADYEASHKDYSEGIKAMQHAIEVLKKQQVDRKQKSSLAQVSNLEKVSLFTAKEMSAIDMFLQQSDQFRYEDSKGAPKANAYNAQSHGVTEMLEKLMDKFIDERSNLEKQEVNSKNAYEMLMKDLHTQIKQAVKDTHGKSLSRTKVLGSKADQTQDLKAEQAVEIVDTKFLKELTASCRMKAADFESRQELRAGEIAAIEKAVAILSSGAVSGNAQKHLPSLAQKTKKGSSFGQLRSSHTSELQGRVVKFLEARAHELNSRVLMAVAQKAEASPFDKVKKMIKDLVVRLMEEANEEADHKGWCDTELGANTLTRKEKTDSVETLHAEIDQLEASLAKLTEDITKLSAATADSDKGMAQATKLRNEEKAKNAAAITDAQEAQVAVAQAVTVLKEFYASAGQATSFLQQEPYKGLQAENTGVLGMLEVVESDFARVETETNAGEQSAQKEYATFMEESKVDKAAKSTEMEHKVAKKQDETQTLNTKKSDLEGAQKELNAALTYFEKLKPSCVDAGSSYEDRVARRKEEIQSLQEAMQVLNGNDLA